MNLFERVEAWLLKRPWRADVAAILALTLLWALFFWQALTPNPANQVSLEEGDFSGQFYAFGAYQARRILAGEVPLWNPYNYGGHPFLADVQTAVFYPPRLLTIFLSAALPPYRWTYGALQLEAVAHFWLAALFMYLFVRTLTGYRLAGLVSALTLTFGGYLTGYPPLQLAILETGIWLPLALLGILRGTDEGHLRPVWLALSALALGLALMAGHPQTALHFSYLVVAYFVHRAVTQRVPFWRSVGALALVMAGGYGLAMLQLLPAAEYTRYTTRADVGFEALAGGFPFSDLAQIVLPNVLTDWSPLYAGIAPLALAMLATWRNQKPARFWAIVALVALGLSFGGSSVFFSLAYLLAPGFQLFRGQERAAFAVAHSVAILAGLGTVTLIRWTIDEYMAGRRFQNWLKWAAGAAWLMVAVVLVLSRIAEREKFPVLFAQSALMAVLLTLTWALFAWRWRDLAAKGWQLALIGLLVFDLFSNDVNNAFQPIPPAEQYASVLPNNLLINTAVQQDSPYRVDGRLVLGWNYGSLVGLEDIYGVSPLVLAPIKTYLEDIPQFRRHELLSVELVLTDWSELETDSTILAQTEDQWGTLYLHQLDDPRPRALLMYDVAVMDDQQAFDALRDLNFDPRQTLILDRAPGLRLPDEPPDEAGDAEVVRREPEHLVIRAETDANAVLSVSEVDYPGWQATVDGDPVDILRAYRGLRAIPLEAGAHTVEMVYRPLSFRVGLAISAASALALLAVALWGLIRRRRKGW